MENNFEDSEAENIEFIFPEEWKLGTFSDVTGTEGVFVDGDWIESKDQDPNGEVRLVQLADIGDGIFKNKSQRFLTRQRADELNCTFLSQGDLLISRLGDPLGKCCIFPGDSKPSITAVDICIVRPGKLKAEPKWLMYVINSPEFRKRINHFKRGTTRARISRKNLGTLPIPLPPLTEQQRIVALIEALLKEVNAARDRLRRVPLIMKKFRQAVLAAACSGRLTEGWREENPDIENVSSFIEKLKKEKLLQDKKRMKYLSDSDFSTCSELPSTWGWVKLGEIAIAVDVDHRMPKAIANGIPLISPKDFVDPDKINFKDTKKISQEDYDRMCRKITPENGDILLSRYGTIGKVRKVPVNEKFQISYSLCLIRPFLDLKSNDYLYWILQSLPVYYQVLANDKSSSIPDLGIKDINNFTIPIPPLAEQHEIVRRVGLLFERADAFDQEVAAASRRCERLTQAVLGRRSVGS
jgi:type I restriction enzyme S subunit